MVLSFGGGGRGYWRFSSALFQVNALAHCRPSISYKFSRKTKVPIFLLAHHLSV